MYGNPASNTFVFDINDDLRRIVLHAKKATQYQATYDESASKTTPKPGIYLVKDQGVYLMSAGLPGDVINTTTNTHFVQYARGHHPENDPFESWYVGGDDYGEKLSISVFESALDALDSKPDAQNGEIRLTVTDKHITIDTFIRKAR